MADSTMIGLGGYDPYRAKTEATKSFDEYSRAFTAPVQQLASSIGKVDEITSARKIKEILSTPSLLENGEIDYQQLGTDLMPYDETMAKRYLDMASAQVLKRETLAASKSVYEQKKEDKASADLLKAKEETDKLDLTTQAGQEVWKADYKSARTALASTSDSAAKATIEAQIKSMIDNAINAGATDMLKSIGIQTPTIVEPTIVPTEKINVLNATTPEAVNKAIGFPNTKVKDKIAKQWVIDNKASVDSNPNLSPQLKAEVKKVIDERFNSLANPAASAEKVAEGKAKEYVKEFIGAADLKPLIKKISVAKQELIALANQIKNGKYAAANLAPFKAAMGALSEGEYGIATDSPIASLASSIPYIGNALAQIVAVDKFNSQSDAVKSINDAINEFNSANAKWRDPSTAVSLEGTGINKEAFNKEMKSNGLYGALLSSIGSEVPSLSVNLGGKPVDVIQSTLVKPSANNYKDFNTYQKALSDYRAKGGK